MGVGVVRFWMNSTVRAPRICRILDLLDMQYESERIKGDFSNDDFTQPRYCITPVSWAPDPPLKFFLTTVPKTTWMVSPGSFLSFSLFLENHHFVCALVIYSACKIVKIATLPSNIV